MKNTCSNHISSLCSSTCLTQAVITLLVLLASLIFVSCDQLVTDNTTDSNDTIELTPLIDSNTNWLLTCSSNSDCDDREICSCGSCVIPCEEMTGCSIDPRDVRAPQVDCAMSDPVYELDSCGDGYSRPMTPICLPRCNSEADCPSRLVCHEGTCKR